MYSNEMKSLGLSENNSHLNEVCSKPNPEALIYSMYSRTPMSKKKKT